MASAGPIRSGSGSVASPPFHQARSFLAWLAYVRRISKCALSACVTSVPTMLMYFAFSSEKRA